MVSRLPIGYQEVVYIESSWTQYIDTWIKLNQDSVAELVIDWVQNNTSKIFGSRTSATSNNFSVITWTWWLVTDFQSYQPNRLSVPVEQVSGKVKVKISNKKLIIWENSKTVSSYSNFTTPWNAYIFDCSWTYPAGYIQASVKLYSCKIWQWEELIRDFVPCYRIFNWEVWLYDLVSNTFYTNAWTWEFTKWADILWIYIDWDVEVWWTLTIHYDTGTALQWYRDWQAIVWETSSTYTLLITDQWHEITCAVYDVWNIEVAEPIFIDYYSLEIQPIEKEYIVKLYDWSMSFVKVLPASLITNDIKFSESIDAGQWELTLNINLPIDTDYFDNIRYCKVYVSDNRNLDNQLLYSGWLSKVNRVFSNNKENIQIIFLSLYTLLNDIYFENDWELIFQIEDDPANIIKTIIDYFDTKYPNILSYTNESIDDYGENIYLEFDTMTCEEAIKSIMKWLNFYLFVWADWVVNFHATPNTITHNFTYEKDITELTIPEDYEQVANAVRSKYKEEWWTDEFVTSFATDNDSINKFGRKEVVLDNNTYGETAWEIYRDSYLNEYKDLKKNISLTINNLYPIESIHPWDTIRIRNIDLDIENLKISKVDYKYEEVRLNLEYYTSIAQQIFNS